MSGPCNAKLTILIDIGNSRLKVSSMVSPADLIFCCSDIETLITWAKTKSIAQIYCASVRKYKDLKNLVEFSAQNKIKLVFLQSEKKFGALTNSYQNIENMGVDRWLAMVACQQFKERHYAVLMFGTAITCDFVSDNTHLGGWIIPGRALMKDALSSKTAKVFIEDNQTNHLGIGNSTPDCVEMGCFAAASGVVSMANQYLQSRFKKYRLFLTGGDSHLLTSMNGNAIVLKDNMVLIGIALYVERLRSHEK